MNIILRILENESLYHKPKNYPVINLLGSHLSSYIKGAENKNTSDYFLFKWYGEISEYEGQEYQVWQCEELES